MSKASLRIARVSPYFMRGRFRRAAAPLLFCIVAGALFVPSMAAAAGPGDVAVDVGYNTLYKLKAADGTILWGPVSRSNCGGLAVDQIDFGVYTASSPNCTGGGAAAVYKYDANGVLVWNTAYAGCGTSGNYYIGNGGIAVDSSSATPGVVLTKSGFYGDFGKVSRANGSTVFCNGTNDLGRPTTDPATGQSYAITNGNLGYNTLYSTTAAGALTSASSCEGYTALNPADGALYRGGGNCGGTLYQMNRSSLGATNWSLSLSAYITSFDALALQPWQGGYIYVASINSSKIVVVDPATHSVVTTFTTAITPNNIAVNPTGGNVYVTNSASHFVYAYSPAGVLVWTSPDLGGPAAIVAAPVCATSMTVTTTADSGPGSLRDAIASSCSGGTIDFNLPGGPNTITLTSGELAIAKDLTITGPGTSQLLISGGGISRVFNITTGTVNISDLTVKSGATTGTNYGAGFYIGGGTVTLTDLAITNCTAPNGAGIWADAGTLNINTSSITDNTAASGAGGIFVNTAAVTLTNSNIGTPGHGNKAIVGGGFTIGGGSINMTGGSITANQANGIIGNPNGVGGAIYAPAGTVTLTGVNITSNSVTRQGGGVALGGGIYKNGGSVITVSLCRFFGNTTNQPGGGEAINNSTSTAPFNIAATNNWWGCDDFPNSGSCQTIAVAGASTISTNPRVDLVLTASPTSTALGGNSTLTTDFSKNSAGATISPTVMNGLPITFAGGSFGSVSPTGSTISGLQATTTFTAGSTGGRLHDDSASRQRTRRHGRGDSYSDGYFEHG